MESFLSLSTGMMVKALMAIAAGAVFMIAYLFLQRRKPSAAESFALILPVALMFWAVFRYAPEVPFIDDFGAILGYLSSPDRWRHLLDFHNEHRIFVPRLFFETVWAVCGKFSFRVCMFCGDILLCLYVLACWRHFRKTIGSIWFLPFAWLLLDLCNYENTMWALCAVQNQGVILFAFLSVLCYAMRTRRLMFAASLLFAVLATLTSGSGLGVWPALLLMEIGVSVSEGASYRDRRNAIRLVSLAAVAAAVVGLYFVGFGQRPPGPPLKPFSVLGALDFGFSFLGAVVPVHFVALPLGVIVAIPVGYLLATFRRRLKDPMFYFFLFLLSVVAAGVVTRSRLFDPLAAIHLRYRIVTFSLMMSVVWLLVRGLPDRWRNFAWISQRIPMVVFAGTVFACFAELCLGGQLLDIRRERVERSFSAYPEFKDCIDIANPSLAKERIDSAVRAGVIDPPLADPRMGKNP